MLAGGVHVYFFWLYYIFLCFSNYGYALECNGVVHLSQPTEFWASPRYGHFQFLAI